MNTTEQTMTIDQAVAILAENGGRFSPNVWSCQIDDARRALLPTGTALAPEAADRVQWIADTVLALVPKVGMGVTFLGYTDREPYEIVRVISNKTIEVRAMKSTKLPWKPEFVAGGFVGTFVNQHEQKWQIESEPTAPIDRLRLHKDGTWHGARGRFVIGYAAKFYDMNF